MAGQLPPELGAPLLEAAKDAFLSGMHVVAAICVVGTLALAAFTASVLRRKAAAPGIEGKPVALLVDDGNETIDVSSRTGEEVDR